MRFPDPLKLALVLVVAVVASSCATNFTPELMREEITRQRGIDPLAAFELNLGKFTTLMIKSALAGENGEVPFRGLDSLQVAVYNAPNESGPAIDVTRIQVSGWEQLVRMHDPKRSGLILVRPRSGAPRDLVVVGAGPKKVVYARLKGTLDPNLPSRLGDVLREGGPDEVQRVLSELG